MKDSIIYVKRDEKNRPVLVACERLMFIWDENRCHLVEPRFNIWIYEGLSGHWHCDIMDVSLKIPVYYSIENVIRHLVTTYCPISESHFRHVTGVRTVPMICL